MATTMIPGEIIATRIEKIIQENPEIKSFYLRPLGSITPPKPGQFYMVWVPEYEEIPISASGIFNGMIRITVAKRGETTSYLHTMSIGELVGLKGPLGKSIRIESHKRYLLIAGGYGVAPLIFAANEIIKANSEAIMLIGAKNKDLLLFTNEATSIGAKVFISTNDGSMGFRGTVIKLAIKLLEKERVDGIIACGPEQMLVKAASIGEKYKIETQVLAESYMKCGIGLCGSCELGNSGLLVCKDGPVFSGRMYLQALGLLDSLID